jgi:hypothetical protein
LTIGLTILQIALIFLPGIIWSGLDARYVAKKERTQFQVTLNAFVFGIVCYVVAFLTYDVLGKPFQVFEEIGRNGTSVNLTNAYD